MAKRTLSLMQQNITVTGQCCFLYRDYWKQGPEYFLLHDRRVKWGIQQQCRGDLSARQWRNDVKRSASHGCDSVQNHSQLLFITLPAEHDLVRDHLLVHEGLQSIEMVGVDDAWQILWSQRVFPIELVQDFLQGIQLSKVHMPRTRTESVSHGSKYFE